jgi:DNA-binding MarR family transcriptional regulator
LNSQQNIRKDALTEIMLSVFRVNARLLEKGDELVAPLGLTSAKWQILGAIAIAGKALTCPQVATTIGITRQGAQKQLNLAQKDGLITALPNPHHLRSVLYELTEAGMRCYESAMAYQAPWAQALAQGMAVEDLATTLKVLNELHERLDTSAD